MQTLSELRFFAYQTSLLAYERTLHNTPSDCCPPVPPNWIGDRAPARICLQTIQFYQRYFGKYLQLPESERDLLAELRMVVERQRRLNLNPADFIDNARLLQYEFMLRYVPTDRVMYLPAPPQLNLKHSYDAAEKELQDIERYMTDPAGYTGNPHVLTERRNPATEFQRMLNEACAKSPALRELMTGKAKNGAELLRSFK
jgi:hypothetical protein